MNNHNLNLKVANPCPVLLSRMKKDDGDYFCVSCSKKIIDFRSKTQEEIISSSTQNTCGIFSSEQLSGQSKLSFFKRFFFYCLTLLSFLGFSVKPMSAQTELSNKPLTEKSNTDNTDSSNKKKFKRELKKDKKLIAQEEKRRKKILKKKREHPTIGCPSF